ncbi:MAG: type II secretion system protein [Terriglobia bacterium]|jgi:prepilin-type N-terminal cleavage/methylation domain-containing protein
MKKHGDGRGVSLTETMIAGTGGRLGSEGYSLLEMLLVIAIIGIVSAFAILAFTNVLPTIRADSTLQLAEAQLREARERAVDQRRNFTVTFQGTSEIVTCSSGTIPGAIACPVSANGVSEYSDYFLPYSFTWMSKFGGTNDPNNLYSGVPDLPPPDNAGKNYAINFTNSVGYVCTALPCTITFQSDGTVVDSSGNYVWGTVFMGFPGDVIQARAISILGATGKIHGYRYNGKAWF